MLLSLTEQNLISVLSGPQRWTREACQGRTVRDKQSGCSLASVSGDLEQADQGEASGLWDL